MINSLFKVPDSVALVSEVDSQARTEEDSQAEMEEDSHLASEVVSLAQTEEDSLAEMEVASQEALLSAAAVDQLSCRR